MENSGNLADSSLDFTRGQAPEIGRSADLKAFIFLHQLFLGEQVLGFDILQTGRSFFTLVETNKHRIKKKKKFPTSETKI